MSISLRISQLITEKGITVNKFEKEIGVGTSSIVKAIKSKSSIKEETVKKILLKYPEVNKEWLLLGEGEMYSTGKNTGAGLVSLESLDQFLQAIQKQISLNHLEVIAEVHKIESKVDALKPSELGKLALKQIRQIVDTQKDSSTNKDKKNTTS